MINDIPEKQETYQKIDKVFVVRDGKLYRFVKDNYGVRIAIKEVPGSLYQKGVRVCVINGERFLVKDVIHYLTNDGRWPVVLPRKAKSLFARMLKTLNA